MLAWNSKYYSINIFLLQIKEVLEQDAKVLEIAKDLYEKKSLLIMGRGYNFATCLEGALKVKELTYMHSEGIQVQSQLLLLTTLNPL